MMDGFLKAICQMGIFMVCAQAIVHFRPDGSYEKYLRMLVSVMILIQIFLPIAKLFSRDGQGDINVRVSRLQRQMEESMEQAKVFSEASDELLNRMTLEEIKKQLDSLGAGEEEAAAAQKTPEDEGSVAEPEKPEGESGVAEPEKPVDESGVAAQKTPEDKGGTDDSSIRIDPVKIEIGGGNDG